VEFRTERIESIIASRDRIAKASVFEGLIRRSVVDGIGSAIQDTFGSRRSPAHRSTLNR